MDRYPVETESAYSIAEFELAERDIESLMESGNTTKALKRCSDLLLRLKTCQQPAKRYYELFIKETDMLRTMQSFLIDDLGKENGVENVYEVVQYCSEIIPRLYLLIMTGVINIKHSNLSKKEIIIDLVEMCRGVQHPLKGMFLRSFLLQSVDSACLCESDDFALQDAVSFILTNFAEMNKLWVRMQHQGHSREHYVRERERKDLRLLVGANLDRIAKLDSLTCDFYQKKVLPFLLEQIYCCNDAIAQEYLMDIIINVFPEEYHLDTVSFIFDSCTLLQAQVPIRPIVCGILDRLGAYEHKRLNLTEEDEEATESPRIKKKREPLKPGSWQAIKCDNSEDQESLDEIIQFLLNPPSQDEPQAELIMHLAKETAQLLLRTRAEQVKNGGLTAVDITAIYQEFIIISQHLLRDKAKTLINYFLNAASILIRNLVGFHQQTLVVTDHALSSEILQLLNQPLDLSGGNTSGSLDLDGGQGGAPLALLGQKVPQESICSIRDILQMDGFAKLVRLLDPNNCRRMAKHVLYCALEQNNLENAAQRETSRLTSETVLNGLFDLIKPLINPNLNVMAKLNPDDISEDLMEELNVLAGVIHLIGPEVRHQDTELTFKLFMNTHAFLVTGGEIVLKSCLPALIFESMMLMRSYQVLQQQQSDYEKMPKDDRDAWDKKVSETVHFCHKLISQLITYNLQETALRFYLDCALVIDMLDFDKRESLTYEFISQAILLSEEGISDAKSQPQVLLSILACMLETRNLTEENHATLRLQCTRSASRLLRRSDQAKIVANCAFLYWHSRPRPDSQPFIAPSKDSDEVGQDKDLGKLRNSEEVLKCLDKATKLANDCMDANVRVQSYIDLLNLNARFRLDGCELITDARLQESVDSLGKTIKDLDTRDRQLCFLARYYENTLAFLRLRQESEKKHFPGLVVPNTVIFVPAEDVEV